MDNMGSGEQTDHWMSTRHIGDLTRSVDMGTERRGQIWEMFGEDLVCWVVE